jgi:hypothetical protein
LQKANLLKKILNGKVTKLNIKGFINGYEVALGLQKNAKNVELQKSECIIGQTSPKNIKERGMIGGDCAYHVT